MTLYTQTLVYRIYQQGQQPRLSGPRWSKEYRHLRITVERGRHSNMKWAPVQSEYGRPTKIEAQERNQAIASVTASIQEFTRHWKLQNPTLDISSGDSKGSLISPGLSESGRGGVFKAPTAGEATFAIGACSLSTGNWLDMRVQIYAFRHGQLDTSL